MYWTEQMLLAFGIAVTLNSWTWYIQYFSLHFFWTHSFKHELLSKKYFYWSLFKHLWIFSACQSKLIYKWAASQHLNFLWYITSINPTSLCGWFTETITWDIMCVTSWIREYVLCEEHVYPHAVLGLVYCICISN